MENILMLLPIAAIHLILMTICIVKIAKEGVENLSKTAWIVIVIIFNLFGPILFLLIGRKRDLYDSGE